MSLVLIFKSNRNWQKMAKTRIVWKDAYMREPSKWVLSWYLDSFLPPNARRSTAKEFSEVSLVLLTLRALTVFLNLLNKCKQFRYSTFRLQKFVLFT